MSNMNEAHKKYVVLKSEKENVVIFMKSKSISLWRKGGKKGKGIDHSVPDMWCSPNFCLGVLFFFGCKFMVH